MANVTKQKRDEMIKFLEELKNTHTDDSSIRAFNEIENALTEKKFGLVFEEHTEYVDDMIKKNIPVFCADETRKICKDKKLPYNFIIEGDNLQALYLLEKTHRGRIDCIYIDPPYNTGAKDWKYNNDYVDKNDLYRHSKWLSMMNTRLRIARKLLKKDGAIITTIDDNEFANLYSLLTEIFPECYNTIITIQMNPGGTQGKAFSVTNEYAIITYFKNTPIYRKLHDGGDTYNLRRWGSTSNRYEGATCFYPIILDNNNNIIGFGDVLPDNIHPKSQVEIQKDGTKYVWPIDVQSIEKKWRYARDTVESVLNRMFVEQKNERIEIKLKRKTEPPKTVWVNGEYNAESFGTKLIKEMIGKGKFSYPKSLYATKDCLSMIVSGKKDSIILDFFAGSGTTLHAVNLLNAEDKGRRKCILVTNNEVSEGEAKILKEKGYKKEDNEWEKLGIAKYVTWPRTFCSINGIDINGKPLEGDYGIEVESYIEDDDSVVISKSTGNSTRTKVYKKTKIQLYPNLKNIKKADGFMTNVKYFKCDWTPRKPEDYLLSNILCLHIREMIELENAIEIDNKKNVIILNKDDFSNYVLDKENFEKIEKMWVNQNIIFSSEELKILNKKSYKYIPKEYFGQELKEANE